MMQLKRTNSNNIKNEINDRNRKIVKIFFLSLTDCIRSLIVPNKEILLHIKLQYLKSLTLFFLTLYTRVL